MYSYTSATFFERYLPDSVIHSLYPSLSGLRRTRGLYFFAAAMRFFSFFEPVLDHDDLLCALILIGGLQHQKPLAVARNIVVGNGPPPKPETKAAPQTAPRQCPSKTPAGALPAQPSYGSPAYFATANGRTARGRRGSTPARSLLRWRSATFLRVPGRAVHTPPIAPIHPKHTLQPECPSGENRGAPSVYCVLRKGRAFRSPSPSVQMSYPVSGLISTNAIVWPSGEKELGKLTNWLVVRRSRRPRCHRRVARRGSETPAPPRWTKTQTSGCRATRPGCC